MATKWAVIENVDNDGNETVHVMPVKPLADFATKEECESFRQRFEAAGCPGITDDRDQVVATYFGHVLSSKCVCNPKPNPNRDNLYIHRNAN